MGIPVERLMRETTSSQFEMWKVFLLEEPNLFEKIDYYLAQIACEVRRGYISPKHRKEVKNSDFLLKFESPKPRNNPDTMSETEEIEWIKQVTMGRLGFNPDSVIEESE